MPYEVSQLLIGLSEPVTAAPEEPLQDALDRMLHYSYSQLPVIKGDGQSRQFYFITHEKILLALHDFGSKLDESGLRVRNALIHVPRVYRPSDNLFELLAGMREINAALIIDEDNNLTHVVTTYDTTQYFRQWAEDIMHARDVEHSLKQVITNAFKTATGEIDEQARQSTIEELTSSNRDLRKKFEKALRQYLTQKAAQGTTLNPGWVGSALIELLGDKAESAEDRVVENDGASTSSRVGIPADIGVNDDLLTTGQTLRRRFEASLTNYLHQQAKADVNVDKVLADEAFSALYDAKEKIKSFNELTLGSYITLFFHERCWGRCHEVFGIEKTAVANMLNAVRDTRNKLAHFREEDITTQQRLQLQTCADWLGELEKPVRVVFEATAPEPAPINVAEIVETANAVDCASAQDAAASPG